MRVYDRALQGAEAGAIAAGTIEISFFVLDLVRLQPLATPGALSGASVAPGAFELELQSLSGVVAALWATYQILALTLTHFVVFALAGVLASFLFDWSRPAGPLRAAVVGVLCVVAFLATVSLSSSVVALDAVGTGTVIAMNLAGAAVLVGSLRWVSMLPEESDATE